MPFQKGNKLGKGRAKGTPNKRTIWLLESLHANGFDYEAVLARLLKSGKPEDMKLAELLIRMAPHIANAPKQDITLDGVETLVINRYVEPDRSKDLDVEP